MTTTLTISLIVRNEAKTLGRCLDSIHGLGDEIVVVDTGSTDETCAIAASHGARVFDFPWCDDFAAARNETLRHATGQWVLWLDADEYFDPLEREKVRQLAVGSSSRQLAAAVGSQQPATLPTATADCVLPPTADCLLPPTADCHCQLPTDAAAFVMIQRSHHGAGGTGSRVQQVRLFPRLPEVRWEYRVHEQLLPSLRRAGVDVRFTDIVIEHTGYVEPGLRDQKLERNLRLLHLDQAERPDDPFTLFNLGTAYSQLGRSADAIGLLRRSLERSRPGDSIVSKLYAALVRAHDRLGQVGEARAACRAGRVRCPEDAELLFLDGLLRKGGGDFAGAETCWQQLVSGGMVSGEWAVLGLPGYFSDVDEGFLLGAREQLGVLCRAQGRDKEAEEHWLAVLGPACRAGPGALHDHGDSAGQGPARQAGPTGKAGPTALMGLGELYLTQGRLEELEEIARRLDEVDGMVLRGRAHLARREFAEARTLFESGSAKAPQALPPRVFLTHVLLQEGRDLPAAEQALRDVLALDPGQAESWRNLAVLLRSRHRLGEALATCNSARAQNIHDPELTLMHGMLLCEAGDLAAAETMLVEVLEQEDGTPGKDRRVTARHNLAVIYRRQSRPGEAESQWRAVLSEMPDLAAAWLGLAELFLDQGRHADADAILRRLEAGGESATTARLRGRVEFLRRAELVHASG